MKKQKQYDVTLDVYMIVHQYVDADNKKEAIEKAKNLTCYGEGEEVKLFEIEEIN